MEGRKFNLFEWNYGKRSRYAYFMESTEIHATIRPPEFWSPLPLLLAPRTGDSEALGNVDNGPQQDCRFSGLLINQASNSHPAFCSRCAEIDFRRMNPKAWDTSSIKLGKFSQISLEPSCPLCNLFSSMVARVVDGVSEDDWIFYLCPFYTSRIYGVDWTWSVGLRGIDETISFSILDERTFRDSCRVSQPELIRATGWMSPATASKTVPKFNARLLKPSINFEMVRTWLDFCTQNHTRTCVSLNERPMRSFRVIDCINRMIVPAALDCKYLALSYVWGAPHEEESYEERDILPAELPRTVEDAILATKNFGFRYIWVDRYCIPQQDNEERRLQIYQMDLIYSRAEATIISAAGNDPTFGLPGVEHRLRPPRVSATIGNTIYVSVPPDPAHEIQGSKWNSRGWTYQEIVLSRRRLIFCDEQVYFECCGMHCYEAMDSPLEVLHINSRQRFSKWNEPGIFTPITKQRHPLDEIFSQLGQYTKRSLSQTTDILNAMMGIFRAFENTYKSFLQYKGVPIVPDVTIECAADLNERSIRHSTRVEQFATGLCWKLKDPSKRRLGFPSWSWTGWEGVVSPLNGYEGYIENIYGINFLVEFPDGRLIGWESFCNYSNIRGSTQNEGLGLHVDAAVVKVRFQYATTLSHVLDTNLQAILETDDGQSLVCKRFYLTRYTTGNDDLAQELLTDEWCGILLGVRHGTFYAGSQSRRAMNTAQKSLVVMVMQEHGGIAERLGLIIFNTYVDTVDDVRIDFDLDRIRKGRRIMQLI